MPKAGRCRIDGSPDPWRDVYMVSGRRLVVALVLCAAICPARAALDFAIVIPSTTTTTPPSIIGLTTTSSTTLVGATTTTAVTTTLGGISTVVVTTTSSSTTPTSLLLGSCRRTDCKRATTNRIDLRVQRTSLAWRWEDGDGVAAEELGAPEKRNGTRYAVCAIDGTGTVLFLDQLLSGTCGGQPCWTVGDDGARYRNRGAHGIRGVRLDLGGAGSASLFVRGVGVATPDALPLTVQLENDAGTCWSSTFDEGSVLRNTAKRFRAATP